MDKVKKTVNLPEKHQEWLDIVGMELKLEMVELLEMDQMVKALDSAGDDIATKYRLTKMRPQHQNSTKLSPYNTSFRLLKYII